MIRELRQLRAELETAKAAQVSIAKSSAQLLRQVKRWDVDGMPDVREEVAA
jgi:hypothetical protein